jgi:hypothetical protein
MDRLNVAEAAELLGITQAAVYKRIQRGTITHDKDEEGRVFVYVDPSDMPADTSMDTSESSTDKPTDRSTDRSMDSSGHVELIAELRLHNEHLRKEVEAWREESRRKDTIIMTMAQRIPELEPDQEPREAPETASEGVEGVEEVPLKEERRSWLYRFFFGP